MPAPGTVFYRKDTTSPTNKRKKGQTPSSTPPQQAHQQQQQQQQHQQQQQQQQQHVNKAPAPQSVAPPSFDPSVVKDFVPSASLATATPPRKQPQFVSLISQQGQDRVADLVPGRHPCECLASRHNLINNCTSCGRVVCVQEGSGPCMFCGELVATKEEMETLMRDSRKSEKLREKLMAQRVDNSAALVARARQAYETVSKDGGDALRRATQHKDRLVQYDRASAARTKVIDDQTDYFDADTNKSSQLYAQSCMIHYVSSRWLTHEQRAALKAKEGKLKEAKEAAKRTMTVTLDFAGRKGVDVAYII